jgi:hypothetical protein
MTWRPSDNYQPGPATWDWSLHALGYDRRSPWLPEPLGFGCIVQPVTRKDRDQWPPAKDHRLPQ